MKDIANTIQYKGEDFPIVFNLNVMEVIQEEYGSIVDWGNLTDGSSGEPNAKAVKFGFCAMLNEGIDIENDEKGTDRKPLTLKQVGRMITEIGMEQVALALNQTVIESTESDEKNA